MSLYSIRLLVFAQKFGKLQKLVFAVAAEVKPDNAEPPFEVVEHNQYNNESDYQMMQKNEKSRTQKATLHIDPTEVVKYLTLFLFL